MRSGSRASISTIPSRFRLKPRPSRPGPIATRFVEHTIEAYRRNVDLDASHHRDIYKIRIARVEEGRQADLQEAVAAKLVHALESKRPKFRYYVTLPRHAVALLRRILPVGALDAVARRN